MYLEMQLMNDTLLMNESERSTSNGQYCDLAATQDASAAAEREHLIALLQCAYSWSRLRAQQEFVRWMALEADADALTSRSTANP